MTVGRSETSRREVAAWVALVVMIALLTSAFDFGPVPGEMVIGAPLAQEEPAPSEPAPKEPAPEPPAGGQEGATESFDWLTLVLVLLGVAVLLVIVGAISNARDRKAEATAATQEAWSSKARGTYGKVRWLHENLTAEFAAQLGDVQFKRDELGEELSTSDEAVLDRWRQLERSAQETTSELYALEAGPPVPEWAGVVHVVADGIGLLKTSVEAAVGAHNRYRRSEGNPEIDTSQALEEKLDREKAVRDAAATLGHSLGQMSQVV